MLMSVRWGGGSTGLVGMYLMHIGDLLFGVYPVY